MCTAMNDAIRDNFRQKEFKVDGELNRKVLSSVATIRRSEGDISEILDHRLNDVDIQELERSCKVACRCIQTNEAHRPTIQQIVQILQGNMSVWPQYPYFYNN